MARDEQDRFQTTVIAITTLVSQALWPIALVVIFWRLPALAEVIAGTDTNFNVGLSASLGLSAVTTVSTAMLWGRTRTQSKQISALETERDRRITQQLQLPLPPGNQGNAGTP